MTLSFDLAKHFNGLPPGYRMFVEDGLWRVRDEQDRPCRVGVPARMAAHNVWPYAWECYLKTHFDYKAKCDALEAEFQRASQPLREKQWRDQSALDRDITAQIVAQNHGGGR